MRTTTLNRYPYTFSTAYISPLPYSTISVILAHPAHSNTFTSPTSPTTHTIPIPQSPHSPISKPYTAPHHPPMSAFVYPQTRSFAQSRWSCAMRYVHVSCGVLGWSRCAARCWWEKGSGDVGGRTWCVVEGGWGWWDMPEKGVFHGLRGVGALGLIEWRVCV